ncbi:MAG: hypothetical protein K2O81_02945, partial [Clostridia bacterium]|nr:hypothetical protein [Clostridia bacterium]
EGSSVSGGNQGGPIVKPEDPTEKDITAEEWQQIFEHTENSEKLTVNIDSRNENISYIFDEDEGYIYVTEWLNDETREYVYALDNGVVYKFEFNIEYGQITKTATEYTSLAEIKTEILNGCYLFDDAGNVKDLYDKFHGNNGDYYFQIGEDGQLGVRLDGGKLLNLNYNNRDDYVSCNFEYNLMTEPYWYLEYKGRYLTEEEWYKAFEMDYDKIFIRGTDSEGNSCAFAKDGGNYYIENYGNGAGTGMTYYSAENGNFYRFDSEYDETAPQSIKWTKIQITEAEYTKDTRVNMLGEYNFTEFSFNEDSGSYKNSEGTCEITFSGKRITEIVNGLLSFSIGYYGNDLDLPQDKLTEAEWAAAISATLASTNFKFNHEHFGGEALAGYYSYFDIDNGLIYREAINGSNSDNLLYVVKNGNTYLCQYDGEDGYTETILNKTLQEVFEEIAQEMLTPSILDGKTIAESYSDFEYYGYGYYILDLGNDVSIRVLVKNGKLSSVEVTTGVNEQTSGDRYAFSNYGETDVETELPWWYTNRNNEIN